LILQNSEKYVCPLEDEKWKVAGKFGHGLPHAPAARTEPPQLNRCDRKPKRPASRFASASLKD